MTSSEQSASVPTLDDGDWEILLDRIARGYCTAFLGSGAVSTISTGQQLVKRWRTTYGIPESVQELAQVTQFIGVRRGDMMWPKDEMARLVEEAPAPDFSALDEPHGAFARLSLPVYLTTNYDDFLVRALQAEGAAPQRFAACWNDYLRDHAEVRKVPRGWKPTPRQPLVFHLHGHVGLRQSMVLTEDDYLDFLASAMRDRKRVIPPQVDAALGGTSLLFVGYRLADWNFKVLFRIVMDRMGRSLEGLHVSVQLPPEDQRERGYLDAYFKRMNVRVYWGSASTFAAELISRRETPR